MSAGSFTVQGLPGGSGDDLLGVWEVEPTSTDGAFSFSTGSAGSAEADPDEVVWSVSLPANPQQAQQMVQKQTHALQVSQQAIAQAGKRLNQFSVAGQADDAPAVVSFGLGPTVDFSGPDASLREAIFLLEDVGHDEAAMVAFGLGSFLRGATDKVRRAAERLGGAVGEVAESVVDKAEAVTERVVSAPQSLTERLPSGFNQQVAEYEAFVNQTLHLLRPTVRVETKIETTPFALSLVDLSGDVETLWYAAQIRPNVSHHHQILSLTLESRVALLQLIGQITAGAAGLAAKSTVPGGALLLIPSVYAYVKDVMAQAKQFSQMQAQRQQLAAPPPRSSR